MARTDSNTMTPTQDHLAPLPHLLLVYRAQLGLHKLAGKCDGYYRLDIRQRKLKHGQLRKFGLLNSRQAVTKGPVAAHQTAHPPALRTAEHNMITENPTPEERQLMRPDEHVVQSGPLEETVRRKSTRLMSLPIFVASNCLSNSRLRCFLFSARYLFKRSVSIETAFESGPTSA